jgi:hypothetical protein
VAVSINCFKLKPKRWPKVEACNSPSRQQNCHNFAVRYYKHYLDDARSVLHQHLCQLASFILSFENSVFIPVMHMYILWRFSSSSSGSNPYQKKTLSKLSIMSLWSHDNNMMPWTNSSCLIGTPLLSTHLHQAMWIDLEAQI